MLLERVREVFSRQGYMRTTVQDILEGTGQSRGAFHRYFDSIDHAFITMIDMVVDDLVEASRVRGGRSLRERVFEGNRRYLEVFARHRGAMRALAEGALLNPEIQKVQGRVRAAWMHRLRDHLVRQCALGRCRPLDPDAATMSLGMMVEGAAMCLLGAGFEPFEQPLELDRLCRQVTDIWCESVYLEPDRTYTKHARRASDAS